MLKTRHVAVAAGVVFAGFAVWLLGGWATPEQVRIVDDIVLVLVSIPPVVFAVLAARGTTGRVAAAWWWLALGLTAWAIGEAWWAYQELALDEPGFPSVADAFFLAFPVCAGVSLLFFWNRRSTRSQGRILLDGLIVAGSLFVVSWVLFMNTLYAHGTASRLELTVLMAYPTLDLVALTIAASVLINAPAGQRVALTLLTLGLALMWVADSGYAYLQVQDAYFSGNLIDLVWVAALLLFTVAAAAGRGGGSAEPALDEVPGWASVWLPYLPLMLAAGSLATSPITVTSSRPVLAVGLLLFAAVLLRQFLVVDHNRRLLARVADQALRDPLTGLANRALFSDRLDRAVLDRAGGDDEVGVLVIDLDDFKLINDTLGHQAGDELLRGTGDRIRAAVRPEDTVARLGGDEFAVLIRAPRALLEALAQRVVEAFRQPVAVGQHALVMRPSLGLARTGPDEPALTGPSLFKRADVAMYAAKRTRDCSLKIYTEEMSVDDDGAAQQSPDQRSPAGGAEAIQLLGQLREALEQDALDLVYQPKVNLFTGATAGFEALLRWPHPELGLLRPDRFLPLVRRYGLTDQVTEFVIGRALRDAATWRAAGISLPVAVNLFPPSLSMPELPERIDRALAERGLAPQALTVEITEDLVLGELNLVREVLEQLRMRGISVAIDDFGSGYSALWYLRDLPVDAVKLDRNFIAPIAVDPRGAAVVRAVIDLARVLGIATIAEGVEDAATAEVLRGYGCDFAQGYHFSAPLSADEVLAAFGAPLSAPPPPVAARWN